MSLHLKIYHELCAEGKHRSLGNLDYGFFVRIFVFSGCEIWLCSVLCAGVLYFCMYVYVFLYYSFTIVPVVLLIVWMSTGSDHLWKICLGITLSLWKLFMFMYFTSWLGLVTKPNHLISVSKCDLKSFQGLVPERLLNRWNKKRWN